MAKNTRLFKDAYAGELEGKPYIVVFATLWSKNCHKSCLSALSLVKKFGELANFEYFFISELRYGIFLFLSTRARLMEEQG